MCNHSVCRLTIRPCLLLLLLTLPSLAGLAQWEDETVLINGSAALQNPAEMEFIDADQDGLLDVVVADKISGIILLHNEGERVFVEVELTPDPNNEIELGDVNGDGFFDIVALSEDGLLSVFVNDGSGNFALLDQIELETIENSYLQLADLDNDADVDYLFVANTGIFHCENDGTGIPTPPLQIMTVAAQENPIHFDLSDLNSDGLIDVCWTVEGTDTYGWHQNDGALLFSEQQFFSGGDFKNVILSDFDTDGDDDICLLSGLGFVVLENVNGQIGGEFFALIEVNSLSSGLAYDADNDGDEDLMIEHQNGTLISFSNLGDGNFDAPIEVMDTGTNAVDFNCADLDNSGEIDYAIILPSGSVDVLFSNMGLYTINRGLANCNQAFFGDLNGDGLFDIVASQLAKTIIYFNDGNNAFTYCKRLGNLQSNCRFADADGDGDMDIFSQHGAYQLENESVQISIFENDGEGNFTQHPWAGGWSAYQIGDVEGDGDVDMLSMTGTPLLAVEQENFEQVAETQITTSQIVGPNYNWGDFNNDGLLDVVLTSLYTVGFKVFFNTGNLTFNEELVIEPALSQGYPFPVTVDADGDGIVDVVLSSTVQNALIVYKSNGDGTFNNAFSLMDYGSEIDKVTLIDFDFDGDLDRKVDYLNNEVSILLNNGSNNFIEGFTYTIPQNASNVQQLEDADSDGDRDFFYFDLGTKNLMLLSSSFATGCSDPAACNFVAESITDDGTCCYNGCGCINTEACNFDPDATCDDGTCELPGCDDPTACNYVPDATCIGDCFYVVDVCGECGGTATEIGCLDPLACNYNENADCETLCYFPGCTNPLACNYDLYAGCDDGSCDLSGTINGTVYHDINGDGFYQFYDFFSEPGLLNWQVTIEELGWTAFTNNEGYYEFADVPFGTYTVIISNSFEEWEFTSETTMTVDVEDCSPSNTYFGVDCVSCDAVAVSAPSIGETDVLHCENGLNLGLWLHNVGGTAANGTITIAFDPDLEVEELENDVIAPTTIAPGLVTWDLIDDPQPGEGKNYEVHFVGPGVDYIDQVFSFTIQITLEDADGVVFLEDEWVRESEVVCAYDPNDKYTAFPGYTEENHFVLKEEEMEYRIRFQNTGNFPAQDVIIRDTLDIAHLDLDSFHPVFGSHDFTTTVHPDGAVAFTFSDIQLPDSTCCFAESQGFVVYRITPREDAEHGDVIHNTAHIFFDGNPAIITNTTWHTIYECTGELAAFDFLQEPVCSGELIEAMNDGLYIEDYSWTIQDEEVGDASEVTIDALENGTYVLELSVSNPLCVATNSNSFTVLPELEVFIQQNGNQLYYAGFESGDFQWFFNGEPIEGATNPDIVITEDGIYHLELTNNNGCLGVSGEIDAIWDGIEETSIAGVKVYPNPVQDLLTIEFSDAALHTVELYSTEGKLVLSQTVATSILRLDLSEFTRGVYTLKVVGMENAARVVR